MPTGIGKAELASIRAAQPLRQNNQFDPQKRAESRRNLMPAESAAAQSSVAFCVHLWITNYPAEAD